MTTPAWATALVHGARATPAVPTQPAIRGDAAHLPLHERARYKAAAHHARRVYPGTIGELVHRELNAQADFGYQLAANGLAARLAAQVLALPAG